MLGTDTSYPKTTRAHNKLSSVWATGQKWSKDGAPLLWPADMRLEKSAWVQEHGDLLWEITCQITSKERRNLPKDNEGLSEQRLPLTGNRHWLGYEGTFWGWWKYKYPVYNFDLHSIFHRWTYILDWPRNSFGFFLWENSNKVFGQPNKNSLSKCTEDFCILLYAVISHLKRERQISYAIANMWN